MLSGGFQVQGSDSQLQFPVVWGFCLGFPIGKMGVKEIISGKGAHL